MKGYLLDTSTCVAIFRGNREVADRMEKVGKDKCFISQIVVAELLFGAYKSNRVEENLKQTQAFIEEIIVTHNVKHFSHIDGLIIEDWIA